MSLVLGSNGKLWIVVYDWDSKFDLATSVAWTSNRLVTLPSNGEGFERGRNITLFGKGNETSTLDSIGLKI